MQLREKDLGGRELYELAVECRRRTEVAGALLIIDDRVDIALAAAADGVHLGQADLPVAAARRLAPDLIIGASSHSLEEALAAQEAGASYVNIGPIFPTATKPQAVALGVEAISRIAPYLRIPWSTMGGINQGNIAQVVAQGARHPAVMSAVTAAPDVSAAARALRAAIVSLDRKVILRASCRCFSGAGLKSPFEKGLGGFGHNYCTSAVRYEIN